MKFAQIENKTVTNIIEADESFVEDVKDQMTLIKCDDTVFIGDGYDGQKFIDNHTTAEQPTE